MQELNYDQKVISLLEKETREEALKVLDELRAMFPKSIEVKGDVEQLKNGKWRAVRYQKEL